ncbi:hypothetical protein PG993_008112 [Apiospora rasikravindrae]|uniref:Uncharacterized protein n=1 Tax=Apiospora rasikravindrae TaxID=990691 RepID=A0ABR1SZF0_9PEZI
MPQPEKPPEPSAAQRFFGGIGPYPFVFSAVALGAHEGKALKAETDEMQKEIAELFRAHLLKQYPNEAQVIHKFSKWMIQTAIPRYITTLILAFAVHAPLILYANSSNKALRGWGEHQKKKKKDVQPKPRWVDYPSEYSPPQPPSQLLPLPRAATTTHELLFPPPTPVQGHEKEERIVDYIASWGYTPWCGVAALEAYRISHQGRFDSAEAFADRARSESNVSEEWRREFIRTAKERRPLKPVGIYMVGLGRCLPLFGLVWVAKRMAKPTEDEKATR